MGNFLNVLKHCKETGYQEIDEDFLIFLDFEKDIGKEGIGGGSSSEPMEDDSNTSSGQKQNELEDMDVDQFRTDLDQKMKTFMEASREVVDFLRSYGTQFGINSSNQVTSSSMSGQGTQSSVIPNIVNLHRAMLLSKDLEELVPMILNGLWSSKAETNIERFRENNFLLIQFGHILDFAMVFDDLRLKAPGLQNDISSVKRQLALRSSKIEESMDDDIPDIINNDTLQSLAMFYIHPAPLLNATIQAVTSFFKSVDGPDQSGPLDLIVSYCKVCVQILSTDYRKKFTKSTTVGLLQRVMVATALLYDHLSQDGIFVKDSPIQIKMIVKILRREAGEVSTQRHGSFGAKDKPLPEIVRNEKRLSYQELQAHSRNLLNVLKYSNKHLKDATTPRNVQNIFKRIT